VAEVPVGVLASVRSPITHSGRTAVSGQSFVAAGGRSPMFAGTGRYGRSPRRRQHRSPHWVGALCTRRTSDSLPTRQPLPRFRVHRVDVQHPCCRPKRIVVSDRVLHHRLLLRCDEHR
jgi:hypothetical protein